MVIGVGELRRGVSIELDGQLYTIVDFEHIKMGRGSAQLRLKLRNIRSGYTFERTFQASQRFSRVRLDHHNVQYLYNDGDTHHFMDTATYDQTALTREQLGTTINYLKEGTTLQLLTYEGQPITVELPITVDLQVEYTEPGFKGDTATGGTKPATLETGLVVQVPLFVNTGDVVRVDTRTGQYLERVST